MDTLVSYIKQSIPHPRYSRWYCEYMTDDLVSGLQLKRDYTNQGANAILIHRIILQTDNVVAATREIKDQFGRVILAYQQNTSMNGNYNLGLIIDSPTLDLKIAGSVGLKNLILVHWQYIYNKEIPTQPDFN